MTRIGWCPGGRKVPDMLALYPGTQVVRIFVGAGKPLPEWSGPVLGPLVDAKAVVHLSFKTYDLPVLLAWVARKPAGVLLILTYAHEPEQGKDAGDPTVEVFHLRWGQLVDALTGHPQRPEILLAPVYTRYWWQAHPGDLRWLLTVPVDAIGWDVYNNGASYRTPDDLLSIPRAIAERTGLPYLLGELGAVRVPGDNTGGGRQAWMRSMIAAADADGALTACWFHKDEWDLVASAAEQHTWREITQEASVQPYLAPSLDTLQTEINQRWPRRDKASDGWIGDKAHQATRSDHNPNVRGSVNAIDVDEDGISFAEVFAAIRRHPAARYVIYENRLYHRLRGWTSEPYSGDNPHDKHFHLSIDQTRQAEQDTRPWGLTKEDVVDDTTIEKIAARTAYKTRIEIYSNGGWTNMAARSVATVRMLDAISKALPQLDDEVLAELHRIADADQARDDALAGLVRAVGGGDPAAIADAIRAGLPADIADRVADELAARLTT